VKRHTVIALVMAGIGVLGLVLTIARHQSVREYIDKHYRAAPSERLDERSRPTLVYVSRAPVAKTAEDIAGHQKPADRRVSASGIFLRYEDDIVSVLPAATGSRILVDDEGTGYRRNYFFVGGFWGRYSGPAESFRGGGPGVGK
jgi:hypothetical protein